MEDSLQRENFPLQQFLQDEQLCMLESILPYIGESLRMPLALSIKFLEIKKILTEFDDEEKLCACGIDTNSPNLESLLTALRNNSNQEMASQIDQILTILNITKMYQTYSEVIRNNPDLFPTNSPSPNLNSNNQDMLMKLLPLLMSNQGKPEENNGDTFIDTLSEILKTQEVSPESPK